MTRNKIIIFTVVFLLSIAFLMLNGCAMYRDISPGTVKQIPIGDAIARSGNKANSSIVFENGRWQTRSIVARSEIKDNSSIVTEEKITVLPLEEPAPAPDYIVGPADVLFINISGKPEFSSLGQGSTLGATSAATNTGAVQPPTGSRVDGNGNIQLPFLGTVHVGGMSLPRIQNRILEVAKKYIKDPWVVVEVGNYRSHPLYLLGQFRNPGTFYMDRPLNLLQGIALGSGYDSSADLSSARLIREKKTVPVDINDLLTKGDQRQNIWLKPDDTIYIPDTRNQLVFVFGAVKKGGPVAIPPGGLTLPQAIATAELRDTGHDFRYIRIIRSLSATRGELMVVDFDKILRGEAMPLILRQGDIVYVPKNGFGNWNDALNEILPSLQVFSAVLQPFVAIKYLKQ
jgi:polysaccharide export outer membrane protein